LHRDPPAPIFGARESSSIDREGMRVNCFAEAATFETSMRLPVTQEVADSSPVAPATCFSIASAKSD
jgi:hypothetical protein